LRSLLKKIGILDNLNIAFKSYCQERRAKKSLEYYRNQVKQVSREVFLHGNSDIQSALRKRLLAKGFNPTPKNKGELHIFVAFALSNWESGLPIALEAFGRVTVLNGVPWLSMSAQTIGLKYVMRRMLRW